jgi:N-hydroxyarylamine O-acetyltransferase
LVCAHVQSIPFENLDVLMGRPIALDAASLERKLVHERRGGYCFEQNGLLLLVLEALGFDVKPLSARVRWLRPRDFIPPRTHLFARVEIDGVSWLADVGNGSMSLSAALRLELDTEQPTPHETRRLIKEGALYFHQARLGSEWHDVSEFTLEEMPPIDCELANWYTSTHPKSMFRNGLLVARARPEGRRVALLDQKLTLRDANGHGETRLLTSKAELRQALAEHFDLHISADAPLALPGASWLC